MEWKEKRLSIWESRYLFSWRENFSNKGGLLKTSSVLFGGIQEAGSSDKLSLEIAVWPWQGMEDTKKYHLAERAFVG